MADPEAAEAAPGTTETEGSPVLTSDFGHGDRYNDHRGDDRKYSKWDNDRGRDRGDRDFKKDYRSDRNDDRFGDEEKQPSFKDSGYKAKDHEDSEFKSKRIERKEVTDPVSPTGNPVERTGVVRTRGIGGSDL